MDFTAAENKFNEFTRKANATFSIRYMTTEKNDRCLSVDCYITMLIDEELKTFYGHAKAKEDAFRHAAVNALIALLDDSDSFWVEHPSLKSNISDESD